MPSIRPHLESLVGETIKTITGRPNQVLRVEGDDRFRLAAARSHGVRAARPRLGARHTIRPGVTGEFFETQTPEAIAEAVAGFDPEAYDPRRIREHALRWDRAEFRKRLIDAVEEVPVD